MSRETPREPDAPRRKRPYRRPTVRSERILEVQLIGGCDKALGQGGPCDFRDQTS